MTVSAVRRWFGRSTIQVPTPDLERFDVDDDEIANWSADLAVPPQPMRAGGSTT